MPSTTSFSFVRRSLGPHPGVCGARRGCRGFRASPRPGGRQPALQGCARADRSAGRGPARADDARGEGRAAAHRLGQQARSCSMRTSGSTRRKWRRAIRTASASFTRPSDAAAPISPRVVPGRDIAEHDRSGQRAAALALTRTRLGIPMLFHEEGLHGYRRARARPASRRRSRWPRAGIRTWCARVNAVTAREIARARRARSRSRRWSMSRAIRAGAGSRRPSARIPISSARWASPRSRDFRARQAADLAPGKVFATLKHLTGHGQPESGTNVGPAPISERELRENFFPPFEEAIARTGVGAVMPSYNEIDGVPEPRQRLAAARRAARRMGLQGRDGQRLLRDRASSRTCITSPPTSMTPRRCSRSMPASTSTCPTAALPRRWSTPVRDGRVSGGADRRGGAPHADAQVPRRAVRESLCRCRRSRGADQQCRGARARASRPRSARSCCSRTTALLPLAAAQGGAPKPTIAVIGPNAAVARLGGYYGEPPRHGLAARRHQGQGRQRAPRSSIAQGVKITENDDWWADEVKLADPAENRAADRRGGRGREGCRPRSCWRSATPSRPAARPGPTAISATASSLDLVGEQQDLFDALKALGKPIVVVLINGRPPRRSTRSPSEANALIEGWYLGEQGGNAVADVLFGDVNPGGKLPVTIARNGRPAADVLQRQAVGASRLSVRHDRAALPVRLRPQLHDASRSARRGCRRRRSARRARSTVQVDVRNTGARAGDETVQLYVRDEVSSVTRPVKELQGFQRVTLQPGERADGELHARPRAFAHVELRHAARGRARRVRRSWPVRTRADLKSATLTVTR